MVHFRNQTDVIGFAEHARAVGAASGVAVECAVADNSDDWDMQVELPDWITLARPGSNVGYLAGCATAYEVWLRCHERLPEWVAIVNTDLEFASDFFERLAAIELPEDIGAVAPDIRLPGSIRQNPHLRIRPTLLWIRGRIFIFTNPILGRLWVAAHLARTQLKRWLHPTARWVRAAGRNQQRGVSQVEPIYAPHGSAIFLHRNFFDHGGSIDCRSFMYAEELHIAERVAAARLRVFWVPGLNILHNATMVTGMVGSAPRLRWRAQSLRVIRDDYYRSYHRT